MKLRKLLVLIMTLVLVAGIFVGCSSNSGKADSYAQAEPAPGDGIYGESGSSTPVITDRKLIRRISLETETEDMDLLLGNIDSKVAELGGYIESRNVRSGSVYASSQQRRSASLVVRIPAESYDGFVDHVEDVSNVTSSSESAQDVTLDYIAVESRMNALKAEEQRLLELIDEAADLSELLQLEGRLTEVRTELEKTTSQLRVYDDLIDYCTVSLEISEVQELTPTEEPDFWTRVSTGLSNTFAGLGWFLTELVIALIVSLPVLIPVGALIWLILWLIFRNGKKKNKKPDGQK